MEKEERNVFSSSIACLKEPFKNLNAQVTVVPYWRYVKATEFEALGRLANVWTGVKRHDVGLADIYGEFPSIGVMMQAVEKILQAFGVQS